MGVNDLAEQLEVAKAEMVRLEAENAALIDRVKRAEAVIAEALRLDDRNQPRNLINHVLATYQNGADHEA